MSEVIVITSGKGGVGKTTSTANIGTGLALLGYKVLVIDMDIGLRNLDVILGLENRIIYNLVDVIEGTCRTKQAIIRDRRYTGLYLLPSAQTRDKSSVQPEQMKKLIAELRDDYDYILLDSPAGIEQGFMNSIAACDRAIVITTPEVSAIRDADRIIGILDSRDIRAIDLVINRIRLDMVKHKTAMSPEDICDILGVNLIGIIPDDSNVVVSSNNGELLCNTRSIVGKAYMNISKRISGEDVLIPEFGTYKMKKLFKKKDKHVSKVPFEGI